ncbi:MAG: SGNH/GDSL hydrolase family protein [Polyangiaceae bacterium]
MRLSAPSLPFAAVALGAALAAGLARAETDSAPSAAPSASAPAPSAAPSAQPSSVKKTKYTVAAMGDSLTDAKSHGGGYLDYLRKKCPKSRFDNYGKGGQMVNQMRKRFAVDVLGEGVPDKPQYSHVIVYGGVNDLYSDLTAGRTPTKIEGDLLRMYKAAKGKSMRVVALTVSPWGGFTKYFNASRKKTTAEVNKWIAAQVAAKTVDHVVDTFPLLSCGDADKLCPEYAKPFKDGLHFGAKGHEVLGKALHDKVFSDCE